MTSTKKSPDWNKRPRKRKPTTPVHLRELRWNPSSKSSFLAALLGSLSSASATPKVSRSTSRTATRSTRNWNSTGHVSSPRKKRDPEAVKKIDQWLNEGVLKGSGDIGVRELDLRKIEGLIKYAISRTNNSTPGPDGIPYAALRATKALSTEVLVDALKDMYYGGSAKTVDGQGYLPEDFNHATMVCLPKKVAGVHAQFGEFYTPENTRPLSIVNTDNRILAIAGQICFEKAAKHWVSDMQQGFIKGRSMVENILMVDLAAKQVMKNRTTDIPSCGAIVLFDFRAAFPSVDQDFLFDVLKKFGLHDNWVRYVKKLYVRNIQTIGNPDLSEGFNADTGIRQGCPLSPILFAIVADLILRKLQQKFPDSVIRAFADDTAMVIKDMRLLPRIMDVFEEYFGFSNLELNLKKRLLSHSRGNATRRSSKKRC